MMVQTTIQMEEYLYDFFKKVADCTGIKTVEEVMADALQNVAVDLSERMSGVRKSMIV